MIHQADGMMMAEGMDPNQMMEGATDQIQEDQDEDDDDEMDEGEEEEGQVD